MSTPVAQIIGRDPQRSVLSAGLVSQGWSIAEDAGVLFFVDPVDSELAQTALSAGRDCVLLGARGPRDDALFQGVTDQSGRLLRAPSPMHATAHAQWRELIDSGRLGALSGLLFETFSPNEDVVVAEDAVFAALELVAGEPRTVEVLGTTPSITVHIVFDGGFRAVFSQHHTPHYAASRWAAIGPQAIAVMEGLPGRAARISQRIFGGSTQVDEPEGDAYAALSKAVRSNLSGPNRGPTVGLILAAVARAQRERRAISLLPPADSGYFLHPTVEVDGEVDIGAGTRVWHFSKLLGPLRIGKGCSFGQNVVVERNVEIGDNVKIQNNVSVYSGVILEDDVFCGPSMVFTNVGTPRSHYPRKGQYAVTRVGRGASIGANATVVCGHTLGRYAFVGAGAVVTRDVPDFALVYGNPARVKGWACYCGARLPLAVDDGVESGACPECSRRYAREGQKVRLLDEENS